MYIYYKDCLAEIVTELILPHDLMSYSAKVALLHSSALCFPSVLDECQIKHDIQGDSGPENVDTTEAVSSLRGETRPGRTNIFCLCPFLPSFDMPRAPKSMLFGPNC